MDVLNLVQRTLETLRLPGKGRLAEQILRLSGTEELTCHPLDGLQVHLRRSQRIERMMWSGTYERELLDFFRKTVTPSMTVLDVGANIGYLAAVAARLAGPGGSVHAFEPNSDCYQRLAKNLAPFPQAHAHQLGISDSEGVLSLYLSPNAGEDGWGSFFDRPGAASVGEMPVTSLDSFASRAGLGRVDLIKIDTEGGELRALRGARQLIERDHPIIVAELNAYCLAFDHSTPDQVTGLLEEMGYSLRLADGNVYAT